MSETSIGVFPRESVALVKKLKAGTSYTWTISGIRKKGNKKYVTLTGSFTAR